MKLKLPSPAMVVALIALAVAMSGTAVAAVTFARNAGAVDGKSAVADGAALKTAAGRLVATQRKGAGKGKISQQYLDVSGLAHGSTSTFGKAIQLIDNQALAPVAIGDVPGLGTLTATCQDESATAGRLDPATTITFANTSGDAVNFARTVNYAADRDRAAAEHGDAVVQDLRLAAVHDAHRARAARTTSSTASSARTGATPRPRSAWSTASR